MAKFRRSLAMLVALTCMGTIGFSACDDGEGGGSVTVEKIPTYEYRVEGGAIYCYKDGTMLTNGSSGEYHFNADGKLEVVDEFVEINGEIYYVQGDSIQTGFQIAYGRVCYFGSDGTMQTSIAVDGYTINEHGYLEVSVSTEIVIEGYRYVVTPGGYVDGEGVEVNPSDPTPDPNPDPQPGAPLSGIIYESDNNLDMSDNDVLSGVACTMVYNGNPYTCTSDEYGAFDFSGTISETPVGEVALSFALDGYITATMNVDFSTLSSGLVVVMDREVSNTLTGRITIADEDLNLTNNSGLEGATVTLERTTSTNTFEQTTTTDYNGYYTFSDLTAGVYSLIIECEGYLTIEQTVNVLYNQTTVQNAVVEAIPTPSSPEVMGSAVGTIIDAFTGDPVAARVSVNIRKGLNNTTGEIVKTVETDENGQYDTGDLEPGNYTGEVVDNRNDITEENRYGSVVITIKIMASITIQEQNATVSNSQQVQEGTMRIVLTWGEYPADLDSHLYGIEDTVAWHVDYSEMTPANNVSLDVDDTSSYGPETITVTDMTGRYSYYVHDFSNRESSASDQLSHSGATVNVYFGDGSAPTYTFYVPSGAGTSWHVFTYDAQTGEFTFPNTMEHIYHPHIDQDQSTFPTF